MADSTMNPVQAPKIDADPAGDLILVVGSLNNQRSIRASSKVLSLASPVLAAMFSPSRFSEGTALSSWNPPEIYLPDDDPEAVSTFCHLAHFRGYHGNQARPSMDQLISIAIFCDKYDATSALNPWSELWLQSQLGSEVFPDSPNLLALAYALDNQESFWTNSRCMMLYEVADVTETGDRPRDELLPFLSEDVYGETSTPSLAKPRPDQY